MAQLIILVIFFIAMYAVLILPQRRQAQKHKELVASLEEGDVVVTNSGIFGEVTEVAGADVFLEVAPQIEIRIRKDAVAERIGDDDDGDDGDDDDGGDDDS